MGLVRSRRMSLVLTLLLRRLRRRRGGFSSHKKGHWKKAMLEAAVGCMNAPEVVRTWPSECFLECCPRIEPKTTLSQSFTFSLLTHVKLLDSGESGDPKIS